jgi:hypothetical protein
MVGAEAGDTGGKSEEIDMPGGIWVSLLLLFIGIILVAFNVRRSNYYYLNRPKIEDYVQFLNIRDRILILGTIVTLLGIAGALHYFGWL